MKKFLMLAAVVALVAAALALPAMAQRNDGGLVNFDDCFPFCDNDRSAAQEVEQEAQGFNRFADNNDDEFFRFFDDREDFLDFFGDRFAADDNAAVSQEIGQEAQSGDVSMSFDVSSKGDYAQQCVAPLQFGNTGNLQNAQGFVQYGSTADDIAFEGSSFEFSPALGVQCDQAVQQSAAASSR